MKFKKNIKFFFIASAAVLIALASSYPILMAKQASAFYAIDPEMAYISNALSFTKNSAITYVDHPGTPTILVLAGSYIPLRFFTKYIEHKSFIPWSFENLPSLYFYTRCVMIVIFSVSLFLFLLSIFQAAHSKWKLLWGLSLVAFSPLFFRLSGEVLAETLSFFLISLWLYMFSSFNKNKSPILLILLSFLSGISLGNKLNNIVLALASVLLVFCLKNLNLKQKISNFVLNIISIVIGFAAATWNVRGSYFKYIFPQIFKIMESSGQDAAHGVGTGRVFDVNILLQSLSSFWTLEKLASMVLLVIFLIFIINFIEKKITLRSPETILFLSAVIGFIFILRYPLTYYQFPNYLVFAYLGGVLINYSKRKTIIIFLILISPFVLMRYRDNINFLYSSMNYTETVIQYQKNNAAKIATLYDYAPVGDFMLIWMRGWGSGIFDQELKIKRPDILELKSDYKTVYLDYSNHKDVFEACWDKLYIRENRAKVFLNMYQDKKLTYVPIDDTGIWAITSNHCFTTKPETF